VTRPDTAESGRAVGEALVLLARSRRGDRRYVFEARDARNRWAHQDQLTADEVDRALDTFGRLLSAVGAHDEARAVSGLRSGIAERQPPAAPARRLAGTIGVEHDTLVVAAAWAYPKYLAYSGSATSFVRFP